MAVADLRQRAVERWRSSTRLQDVTAGVGTFVTGLALNLIGLTGVWPAIRMDRLGPVPAWWHTVLLAAGCLAMLGKRGHPVLALVAGTALVGVDLLLGGSVALAIVLCDLLFAAGLYASVRGRTAVTTAVFVLIGTASVVSGLAFGEFRIAVFVGLQLVAVLFVPLWWAANLRQQRALGVLAAERTARDAVLAERAAMARDLHDVVAAHLSTTAIHSGAVLALPPDTERDRAALRTVRTSSLAALEEMRSMIMLLRADDGRASVGRADGGRADGGRADGGRADGGRADDPTLPGGLARLPDLVAAAVADGLLVEVHAPATEGIPALVDQAAYRIVREALTNARKHAPGSRVWIEVTGAGADHLTVAVTNTLPSVGRLGHRALSAGTGLVSMRERAALLGGELTTGRHEGRWRVHARLPLHQPAPGPTVAAPRSGERTVGEPGTGEPALPVPVPPSTVDLS